MSNEGRREGRWGGGRGSIHLYLASQADSVLCRVLVTLVEMAACSSHIQGVQILQLSSLEVVAVAIVDCPGALHKGLCWVPDLRNQALSHVPDHHRVAIAVSANFLHATLAEALHTPS